ncbi:MAG: GNAT family N-acetyltransferase [Oscillospiraceae bacterium]|nr:GNAT family N-acetyltransferase [Oscillospiraceae bacterium]
MDTVKVAIRHFSLGDAEAIRAGQYPDLREDEIRSMIRKWNSGSYHGRFFEMFAVLHDGEIVGAVSLYEHSKSIASIGAEIYPAFRRMGFAYAANLLLLDRAKQLGYRIIQNQVGTDNTASIRLNEKLGFESDRYEYRNQKDHPVFLFLKAL